MTFWDLRRSRAPPEPRAAAGGALAVAAVSPTPVLKGARVAGAANAGDAAGDTRSVRPLATATECNLSEVQPVVETLEHYFGVERTWRFRTFLERNIDPKWVGATDADLEGLHSLEASAVTRLLELRAAKAEGVPHNELELRRLEVFVASKPDLWGEVTGKNRGAPRDRDD